MSIATEPGSSVHIGMDIRRFQPAARFMDRNLNGAIFQVGKRLQPLLGREVGKAIK